MRSIRTPDQKPRIYDVTDFNEKSAQLRHLASINSNPEINNQTIAANFAKFFFPNIQNLPDPQQVQEITQLFSEMSLEPLLADIFLDLVQGKQRAQIMRERNLTTGMLTNRINKIFTQLLVHARASLES